MNKAKNKKILSTSLLTKLTSPLLYRVLLVNFLAIFLLGASIFYFYDYKENLIETELDYLKVQGDIFSAAISEGAAIYTDNQGYIISEKLARKLIVKLIQPTKSRAQIFSIDGHLLVDSKVLSGPGGAIEIEDLSQPDEQTLLNTVIDRFYYRVIDLFPNHKDYKPHEEKVVQQLGDYPEAIKAAFGLKTSVVRETMDGKLILSVAVPVQNFDQVTGVLILSYQTAEIKNKQQKLHLQILVSFLIVFGLTVFLSIYLVNTIARPIRQLADVAKKVQRGLSRRQPLPNFKSRRDEIGELSVALKEMTQALWRRMDAIERFAADVSHELKNPLTSLKSAMETITRVKDKDKQLKLLKIMHHDVERLDRLITDISSASRLDAEMSRIKIKKIDLVHLLKILIDMKNQLSQRGIKVVFSNKIKKDKFFVSGIETRLTQVFENLIENSISFSPPKGKIYVEIEKKGQMIQIIIDDEGPGILAGKEKEIFRRFYSERPSEEAFGMHSGLGLSIARQIVEAHKGNIKAINRSHVQKGLKGARFIVKLPVRK